jgi:hypothetical protein
MGVIQAACVAIVGAYLALRLRGAPRGDRARVAARLAWLALAAWVGEDSMIRAYGFYSYAPAWSLFVDRVPLLIVAIWPVVVDSAHQLAKRLAGDGAWRVALAGGAIVLADASLIEPIAVRAGLWSWSPDVARPLFDVPPIGVLGWACFAVGAIASSESRAGAGGALAVVAAPLAAHAGLVVAWWGALRWIDGAPAAATITALAWLLLAPIAWLAWRAAERVPLGLVLARAPGAAFFFALLASARGSDGPLLAYALAFAPPYLACVARHACAPRGAASLGRLS